MPVLTEKSPALSGQTLVAPKRTRFPGYLRPRVQHPMPEYRTMAEKDSEEVGAYLLRAAVPGNQ